MQPNDIVGIELAKAIQASPACTLAGLAELVFLIHYAFIAPFLFVYFLVYLFAYLFIYRWFSLFFQFRCAIFEIKSCSILQNGIGYILPICITWLSLFEEESLAPFYKQAIVSKNITSSKTTISTHVSVPMLI